jgi:hypothetical protein
MDAAVLGMRLLRLTPPWQGVLVDVDPSMIAMSGDVSIQKGVQ